MFLRRPLKRTNCRPACFSAYLQPAANLRRHPVVTILGVPLSPRADDFALGLARLRPDIAPPR